MESVLALLLIFGIPLSAIWTTHVRKMKALEAEGNKKLEHEIVALRGRIEVLEQIVTEQNTGLQGRFRELG